ncbi:MAG: hypothetical protein ABFS12_16475 [Bacteroidota bacterium]
MKKIILIIVFSFLFSISNLGQNIAGLEELQTQFQSFNYSKVINIADKLLQNENQFNKDELIEIYLLKGISHYSLGQSDSMRSSFYEILNLNNNYEIDPSRVSPKIINEFEKLKLEYNSYILNNNSLVIMRDTVHVIDTVFVKPDKDIYSAAVIRSMVLPGWGHLYSGYKTKGWILTSASALTLSSMVYFIIDANNKRSQYLNEFDPLLIDERYNEYNTSYKIRNYLIATYALIWIYTQIDIHFISEIPFTPEISTTNVNNSQHSYPSDIQFTMHFQL